MRSLTCGDIRLTLTKRPVVKEPPSSTAELKAKVEGQEEGGPKPLAFGSIGYNYNPQQWGQKLFPVIRFRHSWRDCLRRDSGGVRSVGRPPPLLHISARTRDVRSSTGNRRSDPAFEYESPLPASSGMNPRTGSLSWSVASYSSAASRNFTS